MGLDEFFDDPDGVCVIEWPDRLGAALPPEHLVIVLTPVSEMKRRLTLTPTGTRPATLLTEVRVEAFGVGR